MTDAQNRNSKVEEFAAARQLDADPGAEMDSENPILLSRVGAHADGGPWIGGCRLSTVSN